MHERSKSKKKWLDLKRPIWKVMDDYSGAYIYSCDVTVDYNGYVTRAGHEDKEPPAEHPVPVPPQAGPFNRKKLK